MRILKGICRGITIILWTLAICYWVFVVFSCAGWAAKQGIPMPEKITDVEKIGCQCNQVVVREQRTHSEFWHTVVYVDYTDGQRWRKLFSIRELRKKALNDCDRWMQAFYKFARKEKK